MKYVLKQQWIARKNTIGIISLIVTVINILGVIANYDGQLLMSEEKNLFQIWMIIILGLCIFSYQIVSFCINILSFKEMYFKNTRYLMLSLPIRSFELLGGKILFSVFEYAIYSIQIFFWLTVQGALIGPDFVRGFINGLGIDTVTNMSTLPYMFQNANFFVKWFNVLSIVIREHGLTVLQLIPLSLIAFADVAIVIDFGLTVFASIRKKALPKILSALVVFIIADISIRLISLFTKNYHVTSVETVWVPLMIATVFAGIYFTLMCYLFEKRIEA